ncbi:MAG TPA: NAD(P)/FAD-dependent oxidoreductase [Gemmatimonadaceae bacterium]
MRVRPESPDTDVAIVGAGPAGAAAACNFSRAGFRVVLIDQGHFPRDKVCGDFVGPGSLAELDRFGLASHPTFRDGNKICNGTLNIDGRIVIAAPFPSGDVRRNYGLCIPRLLLDDVIVQTAVASGARLIEDARVLGYEADTHGVTLHHQDRTGRHDLRARLLIGADGSSSLIARLVRGAKHPRRDRIVAVRAYFDGVEGDASQGDLVVNSSAFPGYYWLFPTGAKTANVGIGLLLQSWQPTKQPLAQLLARLIQSDPIVRSRLGNATIEGGIVGWPLATFNARLPLVADRVVLIGDAAGLIDPISGEGIQYALRSARWAGETLHDALLEDDLSAASLRAYAARVLAEVRYDMTVTRLMIEVARNRALQPLWLGILNVIARTATRDSRYYETAAGVFAGVVPARELLGLPFLWPTVRGSATAALLSAVRAFRAVASMSMDSVRNPGATLEWSLACARGLVDLATNAALDRSHHRVRVLQNVEQNRPNERERSDDRDARPSTRSSAATNPSNSERRDRERQQEQQPGRQP